jgi:hypothetical protein
LPGKVEKIIPAAPHIEESEKDHISVDGADHLYRDIWVENILKNEYGEEGASQGRESRRRHNPGGPRNYIAPNLRSEICQEIQRTPYL